MILVARLAAQLQVCYYWMQFWSALHVYQDILVEIVTSTSEVVTINIKWMQMEVHEYHYCANCVVILVLEMVDSGEIAVTLMT